MEESRGTVSVSFQYNTSDVRRGSQEIRQEMDRTRQDTVRLSAELQRAMQLSSSPLVQNIQRVQAELDKVNAGHLAEAFEKAEVASDNYRRHAEQNLKAEIADTERSAKEIVRIRDGVAKILTETAGMSARDAAKWADYLTKHHYQQANEQTRIARSEAESRIRIAEHEARQRVSHSNKMQADAVKTERDITVAQARELERRETNAQQHRQRMAEINAKSQADAQRGAGTRSQRLSEAADTGQIFGQGVATAGAGLIGAVTAPIVLGTQQAARAAGDLQSIVAQISTIKPEINTDALFRQLNEMSTRVPQTAKELGDGLYQIFSSVNVSVEDGVKLLEQFARGATAALTDTETFGTAILGVINAYGLSVKDAAHLSDVFFNTVNLGVVSGDELARSLGVVTSGAKLAGVNFDELGAMIVGVTKEGGEAAQNINNLANFLNKITTKEAVKALDELGVRVSDGKNFRPILDVLGELKVKMDGMTDVAKNKVLMEIFPDAQARQGAAVLISQLDAVKEALKLNQEQAGAAEAAFQKMSVTWNAQAKLFGNTVMYVLATIGAALLPHLTPLLVWLGQNLPKAVDRLVAAFNSLSPFEQKLALLFVAIAAAAGPLIAILGGVIIAVAGLVAGIGVLAPVAAPVIAVIAGVAGATWQLGAAAAAAYVLWSNNIGGLRDFTTKAMTMMVQFLTARWSEIYDLVSRVGGRIVNFVRDNWDLILATVNRAVAILVNYYQTMFGLLLVLWENYGKHVWNTVLALTDGVWSALLALVKLAMQLFTGDWAGAWETFLAIVRSGVAKVVQLNVWLLEKIWSAIKQLGVVLWNEGGNAMKGFVGVVASGLAQILYFFATLPQQIVKYAPSILAAALSIGSAVWQGIVDGITGRQSAGAALQESGAFNKLTSDLLKGAQNFVSPQADISNGADQFKFGAPGSSGGALPRLAGAGTQFAPAGFGASDGSGQRRKKLSDEQEVVKSLTESIGKLRIEVAALERGGGKVFDLQMRKEDLEETKRGYEQILKLRRELGVSDAAAIATTKAGRDAEARELSRVKSAREEIVKLSEVEREAVMKLAVAQKAAGMEIVQVKTRADETWFKSVRDRREAEADLTADLIQEYRKRADFEMNLGREIAVVEAKVLGERMKEAQSVREDFITAAAERYAQLGGELKSELIKNAQAGSQTAPGAGTPVVQRLDTSIELLRQIAVNTGGGGSSASASRGGSVSGANSKGDAMIKAAGILGVSPQDLAAVIGYETMGTFSPAIRGGKNNRHIGLIQFGREEQRAYGASQRQSFEDQLFNSVIPYLQDRSAKYGGTAGMGISGLYRTINGGNPLKSLSASDGNGTLAQHIAKITARRDGYAQRFFDEKGNAAIGHIRGEDGSGNKVSSAGNFSMLGPLSPELLAANRLRGADAPSAFVSPLLTQPAGATQSGTNADRLAQRFFGKDYKNLSSAEMQAGSEQARREGGFNEEVKLERARIDVAKRVLPFLKEEQQTRQRMAQERRVEVDQVLELDAAERELNNLRSGDTLTILETVRDAAIDRRRQESSTMRQLAALREEDKRNFVKSEEFKTAAFERAEARRRQAFRDRQEEIYEWQDRIAHVGEDAAQRYQIAWLTALHEVADADIKAKEEQIAATVKLADMTVMHTEQARATVLKHLASQKSVSQALGEGIVSIYDKVASKLDKTIDKVTSKLGFAGGLFGGVLKSVGRGLLSQVTRGVLDAVIPGGASGAEAAGNPVVARIDRTNQLLGQIVANTGGGFGAGGGGSLSPLLSQVTNGGWSGGAAASGSTGLLGFLGRLFGRSGSRSAGGSSGGGVWNFIKGLFGGSSSPAQAGGGSSASAAAGGNPLLGMMLASAAGGGPAAFSFGGGGGSSAANPLMRGLMSFGGAGNGPLSIFNAAGSGSLGAIAGGDIGSIIDSVGMTGGANSPLGALGGAGAGVGKSLLGGGGFGGITSALGGMLPMLGLSLGMGLGRGSTPGSLLGGVGGLAAGLLGTGLLTGFGGLLGGAFLPASSLIGVGGTSVAGAGMLSIGGLSAAMSATVVLAPLAIAGLIGAWLLGRNAKRRQEEKIRTQVLNSATAEIEKLISMVDKDQITGGEALAQAGQIRASYMEQVGKLKDSKTRRIAQASVRDVDSKIELLRQTADRQLGRQNIDRNIRPEFATGGVIPGALGQATEVIAHGGEIVANLSQQANLGRILLAMAGVPGLGVPSSSTEVSGMLGGGAGAGSSGAGGGDVYLDITLHGQVDAEGIFISGAESRSGKRVMMNFRESDRRDRT